MVKEFLRLENRLILKLEIEPTSPLIVKLGGEIEGEDSSVIPFMMTESTRVSKKLHGKEIKKLEEFIKYNQDNGKLEQDYRIGEPFILGSTLRGLFREKFNQVYDYRNKGSEDKNLQDEKKDTEIKKEKIEYEKVENLFGFVEGDKSKKGRIFLDDAYLSNNDYRKIFYSNDKLKILELKRKIIKTRSITPIDAFTGKAIVPLTVEYIDEKFFTTVTVNNINKEELQNIYFIIRDSHLGEIKIGSSKTRGFGQIKLNIKELIFENYHSEKNLKSNNKKIYKFIEDSKKDFFEKPNEKKSIKLGKEYLMEYLELKEEYKEVDVENPNQFIKTLFSEVEQ